ncbi:MAG TPA: ribulose-phosphate 3-epimerase [Thermomicrobiaceae bacterium]|nr:ribulose-phosphate 3-epimerase [Thermomicrobiaceae bacterium]
MPENTSAGPIAIAPSILTADLANLAREVARVEAAGADYLHLDVMDGVFVPNISFGAPVVAAVRKITRLPLDIHLMIVRPERYVEQFAAAGADSITVHVEACTHLHRTVQQIHEAGARAAVALNPATPLIMLEDILPYLEMILVMSVNPGFGGQEFIPTTLEKIRRLRRILDGRGSEALIETDGGVKANNLRAVAEAGADIAVVGSGVFNPTQTVAEALRALRAAVG